MNDYYNMLEDIFQKKFRLPCHGGRCTEFHPKWKVEMIIIQGGTAEVAMCKILKQNFSEQMEEDISGRRKEGKPLSVIWKYHGLHKEL